MAEWHHQCNGRELGQTSGDGQGQGSLVCCSLWGHKELDTTGRLNNNTNIVHSFFILVFQDLVYILQLLIVHLC